MQTGLTQIVKVRLPLNTPAIVDRKTGVCYVNLNTFEKLSFPEKMFVLLHEAGHVTLQTTNEIDADNWAFTQYANLGYPLSESIYSLSKILKFNKQNDYDRLKAQFERAFKYDLQVNKNEKLMNYPQLSAGDGSKFGNWAGNFGEGLGSIATGLGGIANSAGNIAGVFGVGNNPAPGQVQIATTPQAANNEAWKAIADAQAKKDDAKVSKKVPDWLSLPWYVWILIAVIISAMIYFIVKSRKKR